MGLELLVERAASRYVSRTVEGDGVGTEIWTQLRGRAGNETDVEVEFHVPSVPADAVKAVAAAYTSLYTRLWDEDEAMMRERELRLVSRRAPDPWYAPRYVLPILGMVLGNTLTGMCLVLDTMTETASRERGAIEARLALGAHRFEAMSNVLHVAMRTGMIPILNAMATTGIVALPGMMTGQILAGVDPVEAAKYQVLIMFLIAGATALGVVCAGVGAIVLLTDDHHRLRLDRIRKKS